MEIPSLKRCVTDSSDRQRFKATRSNSDDKITRKSGSPRIMLFLDDGSCVLYNPKEGEIERTLIEFSGSRFLTNSGKWCLMLDSGCNLSIIDVFSQDRRINLPPLESLQSSTYTLKRVADKKKYRLELPCGRYYKENADDLRGRLWVDEKTGEFVVVWFFIPNTYLFYCKKGDTHYTVSDQVPKVLKGSSDLVLRGYRLYIATYRRVVRVLDLSGQQGLVDVSESNPIPMISPLGEHDSFSIAVTIAGEVLLVESITFKNQRIFRLYKKDPNNLDPTPKLLEVDSLGDEALLLDLGITVPANHTLGIKPNCIYFTRHDRARFEIPFDLDICVFNLANKTLKRFPQLANMNLKDAQWFHPMT